MPVINQIKCIGGWVDYPFKSRGDSITKMYNLNCVCDANVYVPAEYDDTMANAASAGVDQLPTGFADAAAYWINDTELQLLDGPLVGFTRTFANVPQPRTEPEGFYAATYPVTYGGDTSENFTAASITLTTDHTTKVLRATVVRNYNRLFAVGAGTAAVNTTTWTACTVAKNGRVAYDPDGGATVSSTDQIYWSGSQWIIETGNSNKYYSNDNVAEPQLVTNWVVDTFGDAPVPKMAVNHLPGKVGRKLMVEDINFLAPFAKQLSEVEFECRGIFNITAVTYPAVNQIRYVAENPDYYNLGTATATSATPSCDIIISYERAAAETINANCFWQYSYVKATAPEDIVLKKAEFMTPIAYGLGEYYRAPVYGSATTPSAELYKSYIIRDGSLIQAEDQSVTRWQGNIYEIVTILVEAL